MGKKISFWSLCLIALTCAPIPAFAASSVIFTHNKNASENLQKLDPNRGKVNALRLRCVVSKHISKASYATVLKLETAGTQRQKFDVAITTGHGLLGDDGKLLTDCFVSYPGGKAYPVTAAKLAPGYEPGTPSDWAVLVLPKIRHKNLLRYSVGNELTQKSIKALAEKRPSILFSTARGLPTNGQSCVLEPRRFAGLRHRNFIGFLSHTCRAIAGQSGAPISTLQNHEPIVLGIHIGNSMVYGYPTLDTPLHHRGYLRGIDAEFMVELSKILTELTTTPQQRSKY